MLSIYIGTSHVANTIPQYSGYPLWQVIFSIYIATSHVVNTIPQYLGYPSIALWQVLFLEHPIRGGH